MNESTAKQYASRLEDFAIFVHKTYECDIDTLIDKLPKDSNGKKTKIDLYDVLSEYTSYLTGTIAPTTIKSRIVTVKNFLNIVILRSVLESSSLRLSFPGLLKRIRKH